MKSEATLKLRIPTSNSKIILKASLELTKKIFKPYIKFIKAGVILRNLESNKYRQNLLFQKDHIQEDFNIEKLNNLIDNINTRTGKNIIGWGTTIIEKSWYPRREKLSCLTTVRIDNIPTVFAH